MALDEFEQIVADLRPGAPDPDLTSAARDALRAGVYYRTLRHLDVPKRTACELTLAWLGALPEDE